MRPGCLARPAEHRKDSGAARLWLRTEEKGRKIAGTLNGHLGPLTMGRGAIYPLCLTSSRCFFVRLPLALDSVLHSQLFKAQIQRFETGSPLQNQRANTASKDTVSSTLLFHKVGGCGAPFPAALQCRADAWSERSKPLFQLPVIKIHLICCPLIEDISDIKLIRTDTTLDLSQKAEKR